MRFDDLLATFVGTDPNTPCAFFVGDANVATWYWHLAAETWVHRADVEHTLGVTPELDPEAGFDALEWIRYWRVWFSDQGAYEPPPAIRCEATDSNGAVVVGSGPVAALVSGKGCDLALRTLEPTARSIARRQQRRPGLGRSPLTGAMKSILSHSRRPSLVDL